MFDYDDLSNGTKRAIIESVFSMKAPFVLFDGNEIKFANELWLKHGTKILNDLSAGKSVQETMINEVRRVVGPRFPEVQCQEIAGEFSSAILEGREHEFRVQDGRLMKGHYKTHGNGLISGIEFDITELDRKRVEARKAKQVLKLTLEGLDHGVLLFDLDGAIIYINESMKTLALAGGISLTSGMTTQDLKNSLPEDLLSFLGNEEVGLEGFSVFRKGLDEKTYLFENKILPNVGSLLTVVDVTELQTALDDAKKADLAKTSFLANMSHEIRTPMNGVLGMAQVLEFSDMRDDQRRCVDVIKSSSDALLNIINDILDYSKLDSNKYELCEEPFDLSKTIRDALDTVRPLAAKKGIEIVFDKINYTDELLIGDGGRIRQVVLNLLSNAIKFTPHGHVKITLQTQSLGPNSRSVTIQVADTGIGIAPENFDRVFKSFEQSDNSKTREFGGTGLGLAICQKLMVMMGGTISMQSTIGKGSEFSLSMDLETSSENAKPAIASFREFKGTPILIVDDMELNWTIIEEQLKPLQLKFYYVKSADHALECIKRAAQKKLQIPLVICDYKMPGKTGIDFLKELRAGIHAPNTSVIILSSADIISRKPEFVTLGVNHVLENPCSTLRLIESVSNELSKFYSQSGSENANGSGPTKIELIKATEQITPKDSRPRILVADDDEHNRKVFEMFLKQIGHQYVLVKNGLEAVKAAKEDKFDAILMDISMPVLNGSEAMMKIREHESKHGKQSVPIIAVTAHAMEGDKQRYMSEGFDEYLSKPMQLSELETILKAVMNRSLGLRVAV
jgi:signal transduction histidine kinase/CheY-like chemotaxis protein